MLSAYHTLSEKTNSVASIAEELAREQNQFHNTRQNQDSKVTVPKMKKRKNQGFTHRGAVLWNKIPESLRAAKTKKSFAIGAKEWILANIPI